MTPLTDEPNALAFRELGSCCSATGHLRTWSGSRPYRPRRRRNCWCGLLLVSRQSAIGAPDTIRMCDLCLRRACAGKFACKIRNSQIRLLAPSQELWQSTCWVGARAIVLAGHLLNSLVRNSEIRRERLFPRYQQKCQQNGRLPRISTCVFNAPRKNQESN